MQQKPEFIKLPTFCDRRGVLTVAEAGCIVPFKVYRVFWIYDVPAGQTRARHGHDRCQQFLIALSGNFMVKSGGTAYALTSPQVGLLIPAGNYIELTDFAPGTVCLVLASEHYDPDDIITSESGWARRRENNNPIWLGDN